MTNTYILSLSMLFKHISTETKKAAHRDGAKKMVPGDGIEPPTRGFSVPCSTD